jgi:hypothetical protein
MFGHETQTAEKIFLFISFFPGEKRYLKTIFLKKKTGFFVTVDFVTVDFNLLFTQMFRTSFRTSQIRCQVQKFIMKFTNRFVNWAFDWLV